MSFFFICICLKRAIYRKKTISINLPLSFPGVYFILSPTTGAQIVGQGGGYHIQQLRVTGIHRFTFVVMSNAVPFGKFTKTIRLWLSQVNCIIFVAFFFFISFFHSFERISCLSLSHLFFQLLCLCLPLSGAPLQDHLPLRYLPIRKLYSLGFPRALTFRQLHTQTPHPTLVYFLNILEALAPRAFRAPPASPL